MSNCDELRLHTFMHSGDIQVDKWTHAQTDAHSPMHNHPDRFTATCLWRPLTGEAQKLVINTLKHFLLFYLK